MKSITYTVTCVIALGTALVLCVSDEEFHALKETVQSLLEADKAHKATVTALARQVSQQQLHVEETTRSYGDSGLKLTRLTRTGSKPYFSTSFVDERVAAIHSHSNYQRLLGMGELVAVLNGVEFRTRHNDYKLKMPSRTKTNYGAVEDIPFPAVPPEVLAKPTLNAQIIEMREWFKAWKTSNYTVRDYRRYFKANLCYLEGMWTDADPNKIDEPFASDRHSIDAKSFFELQEKIRYTSATGMKSIGENFAYLPTTISNVDEHGNVHYSQWNYKILCHPLRRHVPLTRFRLEEDLGARVAAGKPWEKMANERSARFSVYEALSNSAYFSKKDRFNPASSGNYMDKLMAEIPGKDNYLANITGVAVLGATPYAANGNVFKDDPLNTGFYHNAYKMAKSDAMGANIFRRGFSDNFLYVAYTNSPKVTPVEVQGKCKVIDAKCTKAKQAKTGCKREYCRQFSSRVSYAIPLEIVYTTPLQRWNPYNIAYSNDKLAPVKTKLTKGRSRNGGFSADRAYFGTSENYYYQTPYQFYGNLDSRLKDKADTGTAVGRGVLDPAGNIRRVMASGFPIFTDNIPGVGPMRIRYPVMPIHEHGNVLYKDISALTDMTLKKHKYLNLYKDLKRLDNDTVEEMFLFETNVGDKSPDPHVHTVQLSLTQINALKSGKPKYLNVFTSTDAGHRHMLVLWYWDKYNLIGIKKCDDRNHGECWDGHKGRLFCPDCRGGYPTIT